MKIIRIALLMVLALALPARGQDSTPTSKEIVAALQPFVDKHELAGAVTLVADKEKFLSIDTVGFADIAGKRPMTADATFWIASMSKPITGAGLMILVDE